MHTWRSRCLPYSPAPDALHCRSKLALKDLCDLQVALICKTQTTVDCVAVAQQTFQLALQAQAVALLTPAFATIFEGLVNGVQGVSTLSTTLPSTCATLLLRDLDAGCVELCRQRCMSVRQL